MDYLKLCKELCREAGISSVALSDVTGHDGDFERVVSWVAQAWDELQLTREDWWWMRKTCVLNTVAGINAYPASSFTPAVTDHSEWISDTFRIYKQSAGKGFEGDLSYLEYPLWSAQYNRGLPQPGHPTRFTVKPDMSLAFNVTPDDTYVVTGEYQAAVTSLVLKTDVPILPAQFHPAIIYLALQKYAAYEAAPEVYAYADDRFKFYLARIERNQLTPMSFGGPIA